MKCLYLYLSPWWWWLDAMTPACTQPLIQLNNQYILQTPMFRFNLIGKFYFFHMEKTRGKYAIDEKWYIFKLIGISLMRFIRKYTNNTPPRIGIRYWEIFLIWKYTYSDQMRTHLSAISTMPIASLNASFRWIWFNFNFDFKFCTFSSGCLLALELMLRPTQF